MDIFKELNENQIEAIKSTEGYVRVIAGPGSGKTRTIACRYAYMVNKLGISPSNILCITFTNKAAKEMKYRIEKYIGKDRVGDFVCTFHSFCLKFLREEIYRLNLASNFTIMDGEDQLNVLKEIYPELSIPPTENKYKKSAEEIKEKKMKFPDYIYYFDDKLQKKPTYWSRIFSAFISRQRKYNMLDFDDLIYFTLHILGNHEDVLKKWSEKISYIMVDETQDNDMKQWNIADKLSEINKNLFVVGDPDQAIYGWRGARFEKLLNFDKTHIPCKDIILNDNYRSLKSVLTASNNLIKNNKLRFDKDMIPHRLQGNSVIWHHASNSSDESGWIVKNIERIKKDGDRYRDIAVLYRNSYSSRTLEQNLIKGKIPYIVYGGIRFFERAEIKDVISYLRMLVSDDDFSFLRVINSPKRGLGNVFIGKVKEKAELCGTSLFNALNENLNSREFNKEGAKSFCRLINECRKMKDVFSISDIIEYLIDESGIRKTLKDDGDEERMENLKELVSSAKLYEEEHTGSYISLETYLQDVALYTNLDYKKDTDSVSIMTIHQAKGLEFKNIFIYDVSDGAIPNYRSLREGGKSACEEERRLMYVAMTRAKDNLYITDSLGSSISYGDKVPSRFISEIGEYQMSEESIPVDMKSIEYDIISFKKNQKEYEHKFNNNEIVVHPIFGTGQILSVEDYGYYIINFFNYGKRKIRFDFEGLTKYNN
jgi:DNA helicase-2/ATP-dependent DNA helicase PcrA|nr:MAG TPA: REP HELICASE [Caudoviricetes sp.]